MWSCRNPRRYLAALAAWLVLLWIIAAIVDAPVSDWAHDQRLFTHAPLLIPVLKSPGHFLFTLVVACLLAAMHPLRIKAAALLVVAGVLSGSIGALIKWGVGRTRPFKGIEPFDFHPFDNGMSGLFAAHNLSFPSGHACLAFATAAALAMLIPRWKWVFFSVGVLVACERVIEGAHYPGDVLGSLGVGLLAAGCAATLLATVSDRSNELQDRPATVRGGITNHVKGQSR